MWFLGSRCSSGILTARLSPGPSFTLAAGGLGAGAGGGDAGCDSEEADGQGGALLPESTQLPATMATGALSIMKDAQDRSCSVS